MELIADLHIHSRFSRGCSSALTISNLEKWGKIKGVDILGTGDFSHPEWFKELKENLIEDGSGVLKTRNGFNFVLQNEVSLIFSQAGKVRKVHLVLLAPDFKTVNRINEFFGDLGRLDYDGRPIFGINCELFVKRIKQISNKVEVIPAHVWTPWFGLFGSKSGFNSVEECFKEQSRHIYALETGLSSDPPMNWRLSALDRFQLVSNSDSHSFWPWRLAREANVFELQHLNYDELIRAIRTGDGLKFTIEVDPSYGKYHFDGHRNCSVKLAPKQSIANNNICPVCGNPLTIGVLHRVEEVADRPENYKPKNAHGFIRLLPLAEIIALVDNVGLNTKKMWNIYNKLIHAFGNEYQILLKETEEELKKVVNETLAKAIMSNRQGKIYVEPGYDGVYGVPLLGQKEQKAASSEPAKKNMLRQSALKDFL